MTRRTKRGRSKKESGPHKNNPVISVQLIRCSNVLLPGTHLGSSSSLFLWKVGIKSWLIACWNLAQSTWSNPCWRWRSPPPVPSLWHLHFAPLLGSSNQTLPVGGGRNVLVKLSFWEEHAQDWWACFFFLFSLSFFHFFTVDECFQVVFCFPAASSTRLPAVASAQAVSCITRISLRYSATWEAALPLSLGKNKIWLYREGENLIPWHSSYFWLAGLWRRPYIGLFFFFPRAMTDGSAVRVPAPSVHTLKCLWARHRALNCTQWAWRHLLAREWVNERSL